jgi:para-aminobenzoate synthetase / 4-amino-4-deoxychorismate lyase
VVGVLGQTTRLSNAPFALLEDNRRESTAHARLYRGLSERIDCRDIAGLSDALDRFSEALAAGRHGIGLFQYELGEALEPKVRDERPADEGAATPLATLLLFDTCERLEEAGVARLLEVAHRERGATGTPAGVAQLHAALDEADYVANVERIKAWIRAGDIYQVNFTFPLTFTTFGDPLALYAKLRERQRVQYAAYIELPDRHVLSFSPELFVMRRGDRLITRPMKGTSARGALPMEDAARADFLRQDPKNRAENVMIVDLLRNDLGRIARKGSVKVPKLFEIESYATLLQMTSTVEAEIEPGTSMFDVLRALYPCGSVTGAPKIRAMQIIGELERAPRGLYTGAVGYFDPGGDFTLSVAIRTIELPPQGLARLGIGSGIVADSDARAEWQECHLKARFLTDLDSGFALIETMRCKISEARELARRIALWPRHRERLARSAGHFGFRFDAASIERALVAHIAELSAGVHRVRLTLSKRGGVDIQSTTLAGNDAQQSVFIAQETVDSSDMFLRHKTTWRPTYDRAITQATQRDRFDAIFFNERGELAEGARSNVFVEIGGAIYTPPIASGALPGIMRATILADAQRRASERVLKREDLMAARRIFLCNAVRGLFEVGLVES